MTRLAAIPRRTAAEILGISDPSVRKLIAAGRIATDEAGRPRRSAVEQLDAQRAIQLSPGHGKPLAFACPITDAGLDSSLLLRGQEDIAEANRGLAGQGLPASRSLSGWWEIRDELAERLADEHGILLGVIGGFVVEVARVKHIAARSDYRRRKAFDVKMLAGAEAAPWLGFVPGMRQVPTCVERAA